MNILGFGLLGMKVFEHKLVYNPSKSMKSKIYI